jgi:predicted AAA+ superfamily ATPase
LQKIRKKTSSPKILPLCPAFYYLQDLSDYSPEDRGRVFEVAVGCVLNRLGFELTYWRDGPHEVDYILKWGKKIWAIEVKSGRRNKASGLSAFLKRYPSAKPIIIDPKNYIEFEKNTLGFLG